MLVPLDDVEIRLGEYNFKTENETNAIKRKPTKITVHEQYDPFVPNFDLALIHLDNDVEYNENVYPICLPRRRESFEGQEAIVAGWGLTDPGRGRLSPTLKKVNVTVVGNTECASAFADLSAITDQMLCAGDPGKDSCNGDSGGPLICRMDNGYQYQLCGIVSFGHKHCSTTEEGEQFPGVYVRVTEFLRWIEKHTEKPCESGYTCYQKRCSSQDGPDQLVQWIEDTPDSGKYASFRSVYVQDLKRLICSNDNPDEEMFCCRDPGTSPISCPWNSWDSWSACSSTCGRGTQARTRTVSQEILDRGIDCSIDSRVSRNCNSGPCRKYLN